MKAEREAKEEKEGELVSTQCFMVTGKTSCGWMQTNPKEINMDRKEIIDIFDEGLICSAT